MIRSLALRRQKVKVLRAHKILNTIQDKENEKENLAISLAEREDVNKYRFDVFLCTSDRSRHD